MFTLKEPFDLENGKEIVEQKRLCFLLATVHHFNSSFLILYFMPRRLGRAKLLRVVDV